MADDIKKLIRESQPLRARKINLVQFINRHILGSVNRLPEVIRTNLAIIFGLVHLVILFGLVLITAELFRLAEDLVKLASGDGNPGPLFVRALILLCASLLWRFNLDLLITGKVSGFMRRVERGELRFGAGREVYV